jgi:hypothetical protein
VKTYAAYDQIPKNAHYLGSEDGGGFLDETIADIIASAINPVRLREEDGTYSYFDLES